MNKLKILHLEDSPADAELVGRCLKRENIHSEIKIVDSKVDFQNGLKYFDPDVILCDHSLPQFNSSEALKIVRVRKSETPFILVTGAVSEEFAVNIIKEGADDYILKRNLTRLPSAITSALRQRRAESELQVTMQKLRESEAAVRQYSEYLQRAQEEERARIARDLHDELGGQLTGIKMHLHLFSKKAVGKERQDSILGIMRETDDALASMRKIATQLRPAILDTLGLVDAIEWLSKQFCEKTGTPCIVILPDGLKLDGVNKDVSTCFFRICQETLNNIRKHASPSQVQIELDRVADSLVMAVRDNGQGIDEKKLYNPFSMGIVGMRERARIVGGTLDIKSKKREGTTVTLSVLLQK